MLGELRSRIPERAKHDTPKLREPSLGARPKRKEEKAPGEKGNPLQESLIWERAGQEEESTKWKNDKISKEGGRGEGGREGGRRGKK